MTARDEQPDTYPWRAAPPHLMTRRQLRAVGLAPGGAQPVAVMVRETTRRGRARRMWAALFDSTVAPPKREATPAQLEAVAKAVRGRKLRAAQRRGLTEADLTQTGDPGPAWTTTYQEENTMNDTTAHDRARQLEKVFEEALAADLAAWPTDGSTVDREPNPDVVHAAQQFHDHLRAHREVLESEHDQIWSEAYAIIDATDGKAAAAAGEEIDAADSYARLLEDIVSGELNPDPESREAEQLEQEKYGDQWAAMKAERVSTAEQRLEAHLIANRELLSTLGTWDDHYRDIDARHAALTEPEAEVPDFEAAEEVAYQLEIDFENAMGGTDPAEIDAARDALLDHLRTHRSEIEGANHWDGWYARIDREGQPEPVGHGQRRAQLHTLVAVNRARANLQQLEAAAGEELPPTFFAARTAAEERMAQIPWHNPDAVSLMLTDALTWREQSPLAAERADQLIASYAHEWGVIVDPQALTVTIDGDHDAVARQEFSDAAALWAREQAAIGMLAAAPITPAAKAAVEEALQRWSGENIDPAAPRTHIDTAKDRRAQLAADLDQANLSESDRAIVDFTVDYLRGDTAELDLLATPVVVDPGEEARGRIGALLDRFAAKQMSGAIITEELKVMTAADQQTVRAIGLVLKAGERPDLDPWPGYIDRDQLAEQIADYVIDAEEQAMEADFLVTDEVHDRNQVGVSDEFGDRIVRMATARDQLRGIAVEGKGLAPIERAQLTAVLDDIDLGRIQREDQAPEMMFADERTKSSLDHRRTIRAAAELKTSFTEAVTEQIDATGITGVIASEQHTAAVRSGGGGGRGPPRGGGRGGAPPGGAAPVKNDEGRGGGRHLRRVQEGDGGTAGTEVGQSA
ncbi:RRQRL motif-containing zinc-binding protein, partial [Nocardia neocaledoniensis]|uniref:RRQRL motif-containing zinc-binding protein n=1 Tax=Nocardia neocaledoniensis TaxID=236511 RepID=UPI0024573F51